MTSPVQAIEELVRAVADSCAHGKVKASEKIEALRVLAPYYTILSKHRARDGDGDPTEVTINGLQDALRKADSNGRTVSHHQRRRAPESPVES